MLLPPPPPSSSSPNLTAVKNVSRGGVPGGEGPSPGRRIGDGEAKATGADTTSGTGSATGSGVVVDGGSWVTGSGVGGARDDRELRLGVDDERLMKPFPPLLRLLISDGLLALLEVGRRAKDDLLICPWSSGSLLLLGSSQEKESESAAAASLPLRPLSLLTSPGRFLCSWCGAWAFLEKSSSLRFRKDIAAESAGPMEGVWGGVGVKLVARGGGGGSLEWQLGKNSEKNDVFCWPATLPLPDLTRVFPSKSVRVFCSVKSQMHLFQKIWGYMPKDTL